MFVRTTLAAGCAVLALTAGTVAAAPSSTSESLDLRPVAPVAASETTRQLAADLAAKSLAGETAAPAAEEQVALHRGWGYYYAPIPYPYGYGYGYGGGYYGVSRWGGYGYAGYGGYPTYGYASYGYYPGVYAASYNAYYAPAPVYAAPAYVAPVVRYRAYYPVAPAYVPYRGCYYW